MTPEAQVYNYVLCGMFIAAIITYLSTSKIIAPYGRHLRDGWGPSLPNRVGWILMESPSAVGFGLVYLAGENYNLQLPSISAGLWLTHYVYRAFVYPFLIRSSPKRRMPLLVAVMAFVFNIFNSYLNARYLSHFGPYKNEESQLLKPHFLVGLMLFVLGFGINIHSDQVLIHLRKPDESGYFIPTGGLFELVSSPNYMGEIMEWCGWTLLSSSPAGLAFAIYTAANLIPRAISNHQWYHEKFKETYPQRRKAILPGIL